jgi:hypothetical protein
MFTVMFTMTASQIKRVLRENKRRGIRPSALKHIADDRGCARSMVTTAVKTPDRYPRLRQHIEAVLVASARKTA